MQSYRLTLSYDGTCFSGSQRQPNRRTVQGELERTLSALGAEPARTIFAGRTDRGVHANGHVAAVHLGRWRASHSELQRALNARLPRDMAVTKTADCDASFNPRFEAVWREYRYRIATGVVDPFLRRYAWLLRDAVDISRAEAAATAFVGRHDFASFAGGGEGVPWSERAGRERGTTRTVFDLSCRERSSAPISAEEPTASTLEFRFVADGFLPRMVRNMIGAIVEVGQGRREPEWIDELLAARDRRSGTILAPPEGLTLWRVGFGGDGNEEW
jgi:tRNA pseudouridine38-40 synthase